MKWEAWVLIAFFASGSIAVISGIDKDRERITHGAAILNLAIMAFFTYLVWRLS